MKTLLALTLLALLAAGLVRGEGFQLAFPAATPRQTLLALEDADAAIAGLSEGDQRALLARAIDMAFDADEDPAVRAALFRRLGRWTAALKSPADKRRVVAALCAALRAGPFRGGPLYRPEALEGLAEAAWPIDKAADARARRAVDSVLSDKNAALRDRRLAQLARRRLGS